jgi:outer membrane immunogenic protein
MRWVVCVAVLLALVPRAFAGDYDILRGAQPVGPAIFPRWSGFYAGGQVGYADVNADFSKATTSPIAFALRNTALEAASQPSQFPVLGTADHTTIGYGGFAGYNTQWQDLILGLEANFTHTSLSISAPSAPIARGAVSDGVGNSYTVTIAGSGSLANVNYGSIRMRAGWVLGSFMPYGFAGFALGSANIHVAAGVQGFCEPGSTATCSDFSFTAGTGRTTTLLYGFAIGGGVDVALTQNVFVRAEYEYDRFAPIFNVPIAISSARLGGCLKF